MTDALNDPVRLLTAEAPTPSDGAAKGSSSSHQSNGDSFEDPVAIIELIRRITNGQVSPATLPVAVRQRCVNYLSLEGFSAYEISQVLRITERTVCRDRAANRRDYAVAPERYLGDELLGEFQQFTLASIQRLTRMSRDPAAPPYARLWAEDAISRVYARFLNCARQLNYLENGKTRLDRAIKADPHEPEPTQWYDNLHEENQKMWDRIYGRHLKKKQGPTKEKSNR